MMISETLHIKNSQKIVKEIEFLILMKKCREYADVKNSEHFSFISSTSDVDTANNKRNNSNNVHRRLEKQTNEVRNLSTLKKLSKLFYLTALAKKLLKN